MSPIISGALGSTDNGPWFPGEAIFGTSPLLPPFANVSTAPLLLPTVLNSLRRLSNERPSSDGWAAGYPWVAIGELLWGEPNQMFTVSPLLLRPAPSAKPTSIPSRFITADQTTRKFITSVAFPITTIDASPGSILWMPCTKSASAADADSSSYQISGSMPETQVSLPVFLISNQSAVSLVPSWPKKISVISRFTWLKFFPIKPINRIVKVKNTL